MSTTIQQPTTIKKLSWGERRATKKAEKLAAKIAKASAAPQQIQVAAAGPISFYEQALEVTHRADKVINLVLGYLLAIASVLGFMDVLSNGQVLVNIPWAFYVWLAIMGLGVDFQILLVVGRIPDLARNLSGFYKYLFLGFNFAFLAFLGYMSAIIGAVFTQHQDMSIIATISQAMQTLGIDSTHFVYQRAILATLLLVLMAVDRSMERWRMQMPVYVSTPLSAPAMDIVTPMTPVAPSVTPVQVSDLAMMIQAMQEMNNQTLQTIQEMNNQTLARSNQITVSLIEETVNRLSATLSIPGVTDVRQIGQGTTPEQETGELDAMASPGNPKGVSTSYKENIERLLRDEPNLTNEEIADRVGCNIRTVTRWRPRVTVAEA